MQNATQRMWPMDQEQSSNVKRGKSRRETIPWCHRLFFARFLLFLPLRFDVSMILSERVPPVWLSANFRAQQTPSVIETVLALFLSPFHEQRTDDCLRTVSTHRINSHLHPFWNLRGFRRLCACCASASEQTFGFQDP